MSKHQRLIEAYQSLISTPEQNRKLCNHRLKPTDETLQFLSDLTAKLGDDTPYLLADFLVNPLESRPDSNAAGLFPGSHPLDKLSYVAAFFVSENPNEESAKRLVARLSHMLDKSFEQGEAPLRYETFSAYSFPQTYFYPKADDCLSLLMRHAEFPEARAFLTRVLTGEFFRKTFDESEDYEFSNYELMFSGHGELEPWLAAVSQNNELNADLIDRVATYFLGWLKVDNEEGDSALADDYWREIDALKARTMADLPKRAEAFHLLFGYDEAIGLSSVKAGLEQIRNQAIKPAELKRDTPYIEAVRQLLNIEKLAQTDSKANALELLNEFDEATLKTALPYTGAAKDYVMLALGMEELSALDRFIRQMIEEDEIYNCEDPANGVIDLTRLRQITDRCDPKALAKYLADYAKAHEAPKDILVLVSAACGIDRPKLEKKLVRHGQVAIKAYGLFPVDSAEELRARYTHFKKMHKEASQYGAERQANTRAAVTAGLANLAQSAGYTDATRMEWALEADLADNATPMNEWQAADDWEICLRLDGISPRIAVRKGEKALKSVPSKVRQQASYKAMRASQDQIKTQASRFRSTLETMMCLGEVIEAEELKTLQRLPVVATMLSQLILQDEQGKLGLFNPLTGKLTDVDGNTIPTSGNLRIAHTFHLFQANALSDWQRVVASQEMVQPFKQAFRELYIVTPAEIEAKNTSRRFDGQVVDSSVGGRLLQSRLWSLGNWECPESERIFSKQNITASIEFRDLGHYFSESSEVVMGEIQFRSANDLLELQDVNPLVFSEVMRDADLVAGVAQVTEDDQRWSAEVAQHRREVLTALIDAMGMSNVSCKDNFAYVKGSLAEYRIHLGSGVIHIMPGNYLCIVPAGKKDESVYLPFSDTDRKMQEIISKVLLLSNDAKIKDNVILDQIRPVKREVEAA